MRKILKFNEYINEGLSLEVEQLILENTREFTDQAEVSDNDITDFRQRQEEILGKYPSLSNMDRDNITNRMNSIIADKTDSIETNVPNS